MRNPTIRQCISLLPRSLGTYVKKGKPLNHNFSALVILMVADDGFLRGLRKLIKKYYNKQKHNHQNPAMTS